MSDKPALELKDSEERLRDLARAYPEAYEEFPWGHRAPFSPSPWSARTLPR